MSHTEEERQEAYTTNVWRVIATITGWRICNCCGGEYLTKGHSTIAAAIDEAIDNTSKEN